MDELIVTSKGRAFLREYQKQALGQLQVFPGARVKDRLSGATLVVGGYNAEAYVYICWPTETCVPILARFAGELDVLCPCGPSNVDICPCKVRAGAR